MPIHEAHFPSKNRYRDSSEQVSQIFTKGPPFLTCLPCSVVAYSTLQLTLLLLVGLVTQGLGI